MASCLCKEDKNNEIEVRSVFLLVLLYFYTYFCFLIHTYEHEAHSFFR